ncbi:succinylglutamate desuccinylase/aspartoacylase domain-containing protein [Fodinibius sp.]|uniref:succinylglutamate desuccinylase/aspartoacylase domain-containing protein n=1 Tax=Fodinibius sp. TaxID=1872440 RepID=UPI002ACE54C2|nr:succinylglutamate desuccinylase/aspartoacylase family protein [Fodinibius sp.]MDZ7659545.1 succinylglutamate desuccinylase/aspartoacylase family protein [Fodinibius sp.]
MRNPTKSNSAAETKDDRILGVVEGDPGGPTVVVVTGLHGNEPVGVDAARNLYEMLKDVRPQINGRLIILRANLPALEHNVRYLDEDMNRLWFPSIIEKVRNTPEARIKSNERRQMKQLLPILDDIEERSDTPVVLADVHTFSAEGSMFTITSSDPRQRELLSNLYVPMVYGIEKSLQGTALGYYQNQGFISFGLEGGQHENNLTEYNITASLLLLLYAVGSIEKQYVEKIKDFERHMKEHTKNLPVETELVYQHIIEAGDGFAMRPGYANFQPIKEGEWLANDNKGKIIAQTDGYILMPLYQRQGNDGFFIIKENEG